MEKQIKVLHLDDDVFILEKIQGALEGTDQGPIQFTVAGASNSAEFRKKLNEIAYDVVILDVDLGKGEPSGIELVNETRKALPDTVIIMCSSANDVVTVTRCLRQGANDFIAKDATDGEVALRISNTWGLCQAKAGKLPTAPAKTKIKAIGATMQGISGRIPMIMDSAVTAIHVFGESGTGKEVVAEHFESRVPKGTPFVKVNCGAFTSTLLESELFGYVKGAFTGANADKQGLIETANGGWVFLDEIATLGDQAQIALLRVLENHTVRRVGGTKEKKVDIRLISATNESIPDLIKQGKFRGDLWQRLCETRIDLPPLRERSKEIPELLEFFCREMRGGPYNMDATTTEILCNYSWSQGNIRELRNCLRAMTEMSVNQSLTPLSIPPSILESLGDDVGEVDETSPPTAAQGGKNELRVSWSGHDIPAFDTLAELLLLELITLHFKHQGKTSLRTLAKLAGVSRSTLSTRVRGLVHAGHIDLEELSRMVGVGESKAS